MNISQYGASVGGSADALRQFVHAQRDGRGVKKREVLGGSINTVDAQQCNFFKLCNLIREGVRKCGETI